jgi:hypothetical protein
MEKPFTCAKCGNIRQHYFYGVCEECVDEFRRLYDKQHEAKWGQPSSSHYTGSIRGLEYGVDQYAKLTHPESRKLVMVDIRTPEGVEIYNRTMKVASLREQAKLIMNELTDAQITFNFSSTLLKDNTLTYKILFGDNNEYCLEMADNVYMLSCFNEAWNQSYTKFEKVFERVNLSIRAYASTKEKCKRLASQPYYPLSP